MTLDFVVMTHGCAEDVNRENFIEDPAHSSVYNTRNLWEHSIPLALHFEGQPQLGKNENNDRRH